MELDGTAFLLAVAALAMAFVGFSTLVVTFRLSMGQQLTPIQLLTTVQYIELGFLTVFFSLLPIVLALCGLPTPHVWSVSCITIMVVRLFYYVTWPRRWRAAAPDEHLPLRYWINLASFGALSVALIANSVGAFGMPGPGPFAVALTHTLIVAGNLFRRTFERFLKDPNITVPR
jgi:hypothetical protein